ncbi:MAG: Hsp20/alpha crystallin family protein [Planctomycetaceae bacterium]|nr:Hsp20/alpha crystallin family protein [Planctomycetaceae bacterium]
MVNALEHLNWLRSQVDQLWDGGATADSSPYPALNIHDDGEKFIVEAELPGFRIEDLDLAVSGNELELRGKRAFAAKEGCAVLRRECGSGSFFRGISLPAELDADKVDASLRDGVLTITLPKAPKAKPRKIEVQVRR